MDAVDVELEEDVVDVEHVVDVVDIDPPIVLRSLMLRESSVRRSGKSLSFKSARWSLRRHSSCWIYNSNKKMCLHIFF